MPDPAQAPLPEHAVGPDRARWVQRLRDAASATGNLDDYGFLMALRTRLVIHACLAVITPEERERVERIEREMGNG